jgi:hypothetical protein
MKMALTEQLASEDREHDLRMQQIEIAAQNDLESKRHGLELDLLNRRIDAEKYMQNLDLAQRESEFARTLSFNREQFRHQQEVDRLNNELARAQEARLERQLRADLAANPADWIRYQEYMRQVASPEDMTQAASFMGEGAGGPLVGISGEEFPESPTVATDERIRDVVNSFLAPGTTTTEYNPQLGGLGYAGATVPSPNQLSRSHLLSLSDTEIGMLTGLLQAGIEMPGGGRVAINPSDWFKQAQQSWIPTLGSITAPTQVSF